MTRGQLSKIVAGAAGWTETPTGQTFEDVAPGSTFYLYIERVASRGIVNGYPCGGVGRAVRRARQPALLPPEQQRHAGADEQNRGDRLLPRLPDPARR